MVVPSGHQGLARPDSFEEINAPGFREELRKAGLPGQLAFRRLVMATHARLAGYIGRYFRSPAITEDILQETYLAVHLQASKFRGECRFSTWIYSLAYRKICDRLAAKYREAERGEKLKRIAGEQVAQGELPDERVHLGCLVHWVESEAERLPAPYKDAWLLRDVDGFSGEEAAAALGISPVLIRVRVHRARSRIVEALRAKFPAAFAEGSLV